MKANSKLLLVILLLTAICTGAWLWYDCSVDRSGWETRDGQLFYKDFHGDYISGWLELDTDRYYFGSDHICVTGWQEIDGRTYHFQEDGRLSTGWVEGRYLTDEGTPGSGWIQSNGDTYYLSDNGTPISGKTLIDGKTYYFMESGVMLTGWAEFSGLRSYFLPSGEMALGWTPVGEDLYYFNEEGAMVTGWMDQGEYHYYLHPDGKAAQGPTDVDGKRLHFTPKGICLTLVNPWNYMEPDYKPVLATAPDGHFVDKICIDALNRMLQDCTDAGHTPILASSYREWSHQEYLFERKTNFWLGEGYSYADAQIKAGTSVAVPGTSEHQLGLAVDIVDAEYTKLDDAQAETATQKWLMEHCWEYGFILRYPIGTSEITGIIYEPWHYRYVGTEVSLDIQRLGITLEEYLGAVSES